MNIHSLERLHACLCGSGKALNDCCRPYLGGLKSTPTAEALMRSIYAALCVDDQDYIMRTWHESTRPEKPQSIVGTKVKWVTLQILHIEGGGLNDDAGAVEYFAHFSLNGKMIRLHEISHFKRTEGEWFYLYGELAVRSMRVHKSR